MRVFVATGLFQEQSIPRVQSPGVQPTFRAGFRLQLLRGLRALEHQVEQIHLLHLRDAGRVAEPLRETALSLVGQPISPVSRARESKRHGAILPCNPPERHCLHRGAGVPLKSEGADRYRSALRAAVLMDGLRPPLGERSSRRLPQALPPPGDAASPSLPSRHPLVPLLKRRITVREGAELPGFGAGKRSVASLAPRDALRISSAWTGPLRPSSRRTASLTRPLASLAVKPSFFRARNTSSRSAFLTWGAAGRAGPDSGIPESAGAGRFRLGGGAGTL